MARSVRQAEAKVAFDASKVAPARPFLVLMTEAAFTSDVRAMLEGDGLTPLVMPSFSSEGITVPSRRKQRGETSAQEEESENLSEAERIELSWWLKIKLWKLTEYRRIVYLDADTLVHRPIDELFALPDEISLAAPAHLSRDGKGSEISVGVMSLHPDRRIYDAFISFLSAAADRFVTGVRSVDQMLQHSFFAQHFSWGGYPRWEAGSGQFLGCMEDLPSLSPGEVTESQDHFNGAKTPLGKVCVLPPRYDFCVSYPALVAGMDSPDFQEAELAVQFPQPGEEPVEKNLEGLLRARLLHWTGPRRLVQYYLQALGGGIKGNLSKTLLQKTPEMKWWMPSYLGGVNDMLPGMGFVYSKQPHSLALSDIHRATNLVEMFMWIYMITTAVQVGFSVFPMPVYQNKDGWCVQDEAMSSGLSTTILILQILSTFIGSAGFSIISSAAHHVYQELDPDNEFHFKRKGSVGSLYLQLPLLKVIIGLLPIQTKKVSIPVSVQTSETPLGGGNFTTSWTTLSCPVFDKSVCTPMIFCGVVTIFMAYLAVVQMRIYSPDEVFDEYLESVKSKLVEPPSESSSDEEVELCA